MASVLIVTECLRVLVKSFAKPVPNLLAIEKNGDGISAEHMGFALVAAKQHLSRARSIVKSVPRCFVFPRIRDTIRSKIKGFVLSVAKSRPFQGTFSVRVAARSLPKGSVSGSSMAIADMLLNGMAEHVASVGMRSGSAFITSMDEVIPRPIPIIRSTI